MFTYIFCVSNMLNIAFGFPIFQLFWPMEGGGAPQACSAPSRSHMRRRSRRRAQRLNRDRRLS